MSSLQAPFQVIESMTGKIGVKIKWHVTDEAKDFILNNSFDYLLLDASENGGMDDLGFLIDAKNKIKDITIDNDKIDWDIINQLTSIQVMRIGGTFDCRGLDFQKLTSLRYLETDWNKGYENSLGDLENLRGLKVNGCKVPSLESFGALPSLEYLVLNHSRNISSLSGIECFRSLKHMQLEACSKITDTHDLASCPMLQYLWLVNCKRLNDGSPLADLQSLSHLILVGQMKNIRWLRDLKNLVSLRMDCKVDDGNIDFIYEMQSLKFISFKDKKNYTVKAKDIQAFLTEKGHNQDEVWDAHGLGFPEPMDFIEE